MVLLKKVFYENVYIGNINNSDILIESVFNKSYLNYKKWRYTDGYCEERKQFSIIKHYGELWNNRQIYST